MIECPECGGPLAGDEPACPSCGAVIGGGPAPDEPVAESVPTVAPQAGADGSGKLCPECGERNPVDARFCARCRHSFEGETTIFGVHYLVVPALIGVMLLVMLAAAFSFGFIAAGPGETPAVNSTAQSGANGTAMYGANDTARLAVNQTRNVTSTVTAAIRTNATLNATPTRTVDPNATPWNAQIGAGINHTEGGTHYVGLSDELESLRRAARATPTPVSVPGYGDGSGHATGPLSWVGTGNWSPGFIDLPAGDARVVLLSQGTTAFVLVDAAGNQAGFGVFPPPGGQYAVPVPAAGEYVIAFGTANATDTWSATVLLPGSGGQAVAVPVPTPNTQLLTFAGTGGGPAGSFNLSPGTVQVQLFADTMTMAYLRDQWGVTLSTTVAGPNEGGSTVAIPKTGTYRLDIWGTGAWSASVTWTGTSAGAATLPTVNPANVVTTLTPITFNTTTIVTATSTVAPR